MALRMLPPLQLAAVRAPPHRPAGPEVMTEGSEPAFSRFESGYDPADPIDRAILATRRAVFPEHGLMPEPWMTERG